MSCVCNDGPCVSCTAISTSSSVQKAIGESALNSGTADQIGEQVSDAPDASQNEKELLVPAADRDRDGIPDLVDNLPDMANPLQIDSDDDGQGDEGDLCPGTPKYAPGECGCNRSEFDTDLDGVPDCKDECIANPFKQKAGICGCLLPEPSPEHRADANPCESQMESSAAEQFLRPALPESSGEESAALTPVANASPLDAPDLAPFKNFARHLVDKPFIEWGRRADSPYRCAEVFQKGDPADCSRCCASFFQRDERFSASHNWCESGCNMKHVTWTPPAGVAPLATPFTLANEGGGPGQTREKSPQSDLRKGKPPRFPPDLPPGDGPPHPTDLPPGEPPTRGDLTGAEEGCSSKSDEIAQRGFDILRSRCSSCHTSQDGKNGRGGINIFTPKEDGTLAIDKRVFTKKPRGLGSELGYFVVKAGNSAESVLSYSITPDDVVVANGVKGFGSMPPDKTARLTAAEIDTVRKWIDAGFKDPPQKTRKGRVYSELDVMQAFYLALQGIPAEDRRYIRAFYDPTYNNKNVDGCGLERLRSNLSLVINGLHWNKQMVHPYPVNKNLVMSGLPEKERARFDEIDRVLYLVDLRDLYQGCTGNFGIVNPLWLRAWSSVFLKSTTRDWHRWTAPEWPTFAGWESYPSFYIERGIEANYPYNNAALFLTDPAASATKLPFEKGERSVYQVANWLYSQTGSYVPYIRADWFSNESRRGLYAQLLGLPGNSFELETALGVNVGKVKRIRYDKLTGERQETVVAIPVIAKDFVGYTVSERGKKVRRRLRRSGRKKSNVTQKNRIIDVHDTCIKGKYWISYDVFDEQNNRDLVNKPLGPDQWRIFVYNILIKDIADFGYANSTLKNFFADVFNAYRTQDGHLFYQFLDSSAFKQDGGEVIWTLPNGLHAYFVVDGKQNLLHEVPGQVASNPSNYDKRDGENPVINGSTCMYCHNTGIVAYEDTIQDPIRASARYRSTNFFVWQPSNKGLTLRIHPRVHDKPHYYPLYWSLGEYVFDLAYLFPYNRKGYHYHSSWGDFRKEDNSWGEFKPYSWKVDDLFAELGNFEKRTGELYQLQDQGEKQFVAAWKKAVSPYVRDPKSVDALGNLTSLGASAYYKDLDLAEIAAETGLVNDKREVSVSRLRELSKRVFSIADRLQSLIGSDPRPITRDRMEDTALWRDLTRYGLLADTKTTYKVGGPYYDWSSYSIGAVNAAVAVSLAQNNAFNLNVGIQDFRGRSFVLLTDLTEPARHLIVTEKKLEFGEFVRSNVIAPIERIRDNLELNFNDVTSADLTGDKANKTVNAIITQINTLGKVLYTRFEFENRYFYVKDFLDESALLRFWILREDLLRVIKLHKEAVNASKSGAW